MLKFGLFVAFLSKVILVVLATESSESVEYSSSEESSSEEDFSEAEAYSSSSTHETTSYEEDNSGSETYSSSCSTHETPISESCKGDPNAFLSSCANNCPNECFYLNKTQYVCPAYCGVGCQCKKGFYLDNNTGKCVYPEQCTPVCKINEEYSNCSNGLCRFQDCTQYGNPIPFCPRFDKTKCKGSCICKDKYLRNPQGVCVPQEECPSYLCLKANHEVYSDCTNGGCFRRNCSQVGLPIYCPKIDPADCIKGCICEEGYLRAKDGTCIPAKECPYSCLKSNHEVYSDCTNGGCFRRNCSQVGLPIYCPKIDPADCIKGCNCEEGYLRAKDGTCIPAKECPYSCLKSNHEVYSDCTNGGCFRRNCSQVGLPIYCPKIDPADCIKGCICEEGYLRAKDGTCIPTKECPYSCLKSNHEVYSDCTNGGCFRRNCSQVGLPIYCPKIDPADCIKGCICEEGYLRAKDGTCICEKECPIVCRGKNEVYSNCTNGGCGAKQCSQLGYKVPCIDPNSDSCIKGCACIDGYVRNDKGKCIPSNQCPSCGGDPNAEPGCSINCGRHCSNYMQKHPICPLRPCYINDCQCRPDYVFDDNIGKCVYPKDCTPVCKENEVFSNCTNGGCDARNCSQLGYPVPCCKKDDVKCKNGCICQLGYLRADNGTCIPSNQCPSVCKENEVYSNCTNGGCGAKYCSQLGYPQPCVDYNSESCVKGCACINGYVRNENGKCIPSYQCPSCGGDPNAQPGCGINCGRHCSNYKNKHPICPRIACIINRCDCRPKFVYDDNLKKCVLPKDCTPTCKENEVFSNCTNGGCAPTKCSQLGFPVPCPRLNPAYCKKGCVCEPGYVRAENGTCIPSKQCPSCGGDNNAIPGCSNYCGRRCTDIGKNGTTICPRFCMFNGCACKPNYWYDTNTKKCVKASQCTPVCKINEEYSNCSNGLCRFQDCTHYKDPIPFCPRFDKTKCKGSCICKDKYLRNPQGVCVPQEECPSYLCPIANHEVYSNCTNGGCFPQNCSQVGLTIACPKIDPADCIKGCICEEGYLRAKNGTCIPKKECPIVCRGENEVYSNCTNGGCGAKYCSQLGYPQPCVDYNSDSCVKGCACINGYVRNENGKCIPSDQCPSCGGDPNARPGCGINCGRHCSNYKNKHPICPRIACIINRCDCKPKFVYDDNLKKCVLPKDCTPTCKENEVFSNCTNGGCSPTKCSQLGFPVPCPKLNPAYCKKGCVCVPGYVRAENGTCIPSKQCPSCGGDNNAIPGCSNYCGRRCTDIGKNGTTICPRFCMFNGCACKPNYWYDTNTKKCVKASQCTPVCKINEEYSNCSNGLCRFQDCTHYGDPIPFCPRFDKTKCKGSCICKDKYLRNPQGVCVPQEECPSYLCPIANHEVYSNCTNGGCFPQNCSQVGLTIACSKIDPADCIKGCICEEGYLRAKNGTCIPKKECPIVCRGENEVYSNCTNGGCGAKYCSQLGYPQPCVDYNSDSCVKGCACINGYVRNENGKCIPSDQCPSCGGDPNARPGCGINCGRHCSNYKNKHPICPRIACIINRCDCKPKFVYDDNLKKCVLPKDCTPTCKENEVFSNCTNGGCSPTKCSQLGFPVPCPKLNPAYCKKGCVCVPGYVRAENGTCIPSDQCPSCGGDPNAQPGCGINCGRHCSNYKNKHPICPRIACLRNKCDCRKDYVYDDNIKKCVFPKDCTPTCQLHEVFSNCSNDGSVTRNCSQLGSSVRSCKLKPKCCIKGCVCQEGYLRADNGTCIPKDQCCKPNPDTCGDTDGSDDGNCTDALQRLLDGNTLFTGNFLSVVVQRNLGKSVVMSPFCVLVSLAHISCATKGKCNNQLMSILNLKTKAEIICSFQEFIRSYTAQQESKLDLAAKVYVNEKINLTENFKKTSVALGAEAENVNFSNAEQAADTINKWVEEKTNNRIKDLVSQSMFSSMTRLVLTNIVYFLGSWVKQFDSKQTRKGIFYINEKDSVQKDFMHRKGSFKYADIKSLDAKALEIPYKGGNCTFLAILPNTRDGCVNLVEKLRVPSILNGARGQLSYSTVDCTLPPFKIESSLDLINILKQLGVSDIFDANKSNLDNIVENHEKLAVTDFVHKAYIKVNENGTEAAAASAAVIGLTSVRQTIYFNANHPFVFYIYLYNTPLFCGVVTAN